MYLNCSSSIGSSSFPCRKRVLADEANRAFDRAWCGNFPVISSFANLCRTSHRRCWTRGRSMNHKQGVSTKNSIVPETTPSVHCMPEQHTILAGKVHVYKRPNSSLWQCSTYFAGQKPAHQQHGREPLESQGIRRGLVSAAARKTPLR